MWDFLNTVLEQAGFVAALYVVTLGGAGLVVRSLLRQVASVQQRLLDAERRAARAIESKSSAVELARAEAAKARLEMRRAFAEERERITEEHARELVVVADQGRAEAQKFGDRVDLLREKHTDQMVELVEKSTRHIERIDQSVSRLGAAVDVLVRIER